MENIFATIVKMSSIQKKMDSNVVQYLVVQLVMYVLCYYLHNWKEVGDGDCGTSLQTLGRN
jgi:hypothetical protein